ncbi:MAG: hypothetical protein KatS3mg102_0084 [Planctomycetota bacterium]|nr:MAG: hypothetical protein KatS3mg102_0084 [Planctomycetota bacterium]
MALTAQEMIGKKVGDYQITELLGEGGMGMVFKGLHPTLGQIVAIKSLHPNLVKADAIKKRFEREARAMARLRHPNILQIYNFVENELGCFIVMEFAEGKEFEEMISERGLIPPVEAIDLFLPVLDAMHFAHTAGVIHRDIKPSNLMLLNSGVVKVLDFGTAKLAGDSGPQLTAAGMTLGTVVYMSPEQLMGRDLSPQADIYSLGVTLYEMTTGKLPFYDENEMKLMRMIMKEPPPPPRMAYPAMPASLEAVILRAMEKDRAKRFKDAAEFKAALLQVKAELTGVPAGVSSGMVAGRIGSDPAVVSPGAQPTPPGVATPVEDTQQLPRAPVSGPVAAPAASNAPTVLAITGGVLAGLGLLLGLVLTFAVQPGWVGAAVGGPLLLVGGVLLGVGLAMRPAAATADAGAAAPGATRMLDSAAVTQSMQPATQPQGAAAGATPVAPEVTGRFLEVIAGPIAGHRVELDEQPMTIGRAPDNRLPLPDPAVSSHHARIDFYQGRYFISDLQSSNGTYVNNGRIEQAPLNDGDTIIVGQSQIRVVLR